MYNFKVTSLYWLTCWETFRIFHYIKDKINCNQHWSSALRGPFQLHCWRISSFQELFPPNHSLSALSYFMFMEITISSRIANIYLHCSSQQTVPGAVTRHCNLNEIQHSQWSQNVTLQHFNFTKFHPFLASPAGAREWKYLNTAQPKLRGYAPFSFLAHFRKFQARYRSTTVCKDTGVTRPERKKELTANRNILVIVHGMESSKKMS